MRSLILQRINAHSIVRRLTPRSTTGTTTARPTLASCQQRFSSSDTPKRRPRRKKQKYEQFSEAKLATGVLPTTTSLESPFEYNSGDSIEDYKKKAELSPWTPVPDSVARKIFDRAIPPENDYSDRSKEDEVSYPKYFASRPLERYSSLSLFEAPLLTSFYFLVAVLMFLD